MSKAIVDFAPDSDPLNSTAGFHLGRTNLTGADRDRFWTPPVLARQLLAATDGLTAQGVIGVSISPNFSAGGLVDAATTGAFSDSSYSNGTSGVGATLTSNTNGALPAQDGVTLIVGNRLFVKNQVVEVTNGIYDVTQLGDAGNPWVLTRSSDADSAGELGGIIVRINGGYAQSGDQYYLPLAPGQIVVGNTRLPFVLKVLKHAGATFGPNAAVSGNVPVFSGTTGKLLADSGKAQPSGAFVGTTDAQTLSSKTLTSPVLNGSTVDYLLFGPHRWDFPASGIGDTFVGTDSVQSLANKNLLGFTFQDALDTSKQARFDLSGITTGTLRVYTLPNSTATLVGAATPQTLTSKTFDTASNTFKVAGTTVTGASGSGGVLITNTGPTINSPVLMNGATVDYFLYGPLRWDFPSSGIGDVFVGLSSLQTLTNKTISGGILTSGLSVRTLIDLSPAGGGQIKFPTIQAASSDLNTLDDYVEATPTPTISFATPGDLSVSYSSQTCHYTKIGNRVFGEVMLIFVPTFATASGTFQILTGAPNPAADDGQTAAAYLYGTGLTWPTNATQLNTLRVSSTATILRASGNGITTTVSMQASNFTSGQTYNLRFSFNYRTT